MKTLYYVGTVYTATVSRKTHQSRPLDLFLHKIMMRQQNTFGTVQAFVQQMALWLNPGLYKRLALTDEDRSALDLLPFCPKSQTFNMWDT